MQTSTAFFSVFALSVVLLIVHTNGAYLAGNNVRNYELFRQRGGETKPVSEVAKKLKKKQRKSDAVLEKNSRNTGRQKGKFQDKVGVDRREEDQEIVGDEESGDDVELGLPRVPFKNVLQRSWDRTPPITFTYLITSFLITAFAFVFNKNQWPNFLHFNWNDILLKGKVWKLFSGFFYLGPLDLFYPLTLQFIWQNMSQLEKLYYKTPEEFLALVSFGAVMLVSFYTLLGLPMTMLGHNLGSFLLYIWSKLFEGMDVNFMDLFVLKSELLPYFFCLQSVLLDQQFPTGDLLGIVIGYFYYILKQKNKIWIPSSVREFFQNNSFIRAQYQKFKDDFEL